MTSAVSLVEPSSVFARVTVVQSDEADLDRDRAAAAALLGQALAELLGRALRRIVSSSSWEAMSVSKVRSVETDLAAPDSVSTGESSWKVARAFR